MQEKYKRKRKACFRMQQAEIAVLPWPGLHIEGVTSARGPINNAESPQACSRWAQQPRPSRCHFKTLPLEVRTRPCSHAGRSEAPENSQASWSAPLGEGEPRPSCFTDRWLHTFGTNSGKQVCDPYVAMPQLFCGWLHNSTQTLIRPRCICREGGVLVYWE